MCIVIAPAVLAGIAIASTVAATAVGVVGTMEQASAQKKAANYNAAVEENNAKVAEWNSRKATAEASNQASDIRRQGARVLGSQRAAGAASGIDPSGTAADVSFDSLINTETDALLTKYRGKVDSWNSGVQANNNRASAQLYRSQGKSAQTAGLLSAVGTGIGGLGQAAGQYGKFTA